MNFDTLVRAALDSSDKPDPADVAQTAFSAADPADYPALLLEALAQRAAQLTSYGRNVAVSGLAQTRMISHPSRKIAAIRATFQKTLAQRVFVDGTWKFLGDCTAADCRWIAADRRARAQMMLTVADAFLRVAAELDAEGAQTVSDLDPSLVRGLAA